MYYFSGSTLSFYPAELIGRYRQAGTFPDDAKKISNSAYIEFSSGAPAGKKLGSSEGQPAWVDLVVPPLSIGSAKEIISGRYIYAMRDLRSGYSQEEVNTFDDKRISADAYRAGTSTAEQRVILARFEGLYLSESPQTDADFEAIDAAFTPEDIAKISERADKIIAARRVYTNISSLIEGIRNTHWAQLVDGQDNQPVIDSLTAAYVQLEAQLQAVNRAVI